MKNSFACTLAAQIYRQMKKTDDPITWSDAMSWAWLMVNKTYQELTLVTFTKVKDGSTCRRVVSENVSLYYTPKGTGRPMKENQVLFVDLGKYVVDGSSFLISTYTDKIVSRVNLAA